MNRTLLTKSRYEDRYGQQKIDQSRMITTSLAETFNVGTKSYFQDKTRSLTKVINCARLEGMIALLYVGRTDWLTRLIAGHTDTQERGNKTK